MPGNLLQRNIKTSKRKSRRRPQLSDFHEMVSSLQRRKERILRIKNPVDNIDKDGRRLGFERRQFTYSLHYPERRFGVDRRHIPERRIED